MKKFILIILTLFLLFLNTIADAASNVTKKEIAAVSEDGFNIKAVLTYPNKKNQKEFKTVVLLHSLGYNSQWWGDLPQNLLNNGYAVLAIDLRGHGESIYNAKLKKTSWKSMKNSAYAKYPADIIAVLEKIKADNPKREFFNNWTVVASDIGNNAGIIAFDKWNKHPKSIVMISPSIEMRGLYIPVSVAHLTSVDFLSISGTGDYASQETAEYLKKFAQAGFTTFVSDSKTTGMLILKNDEKLSNLISEWIKTYLN